MLLTIISFVAILMILIFVHELGHFLCAKLLKVRVETFSLGFPPKIFSRKIGETEYQIAWLPLGGYVKLFGEDPNDKSVTPDQRKWSFSHKPAWAKSLIVLAGPIFNLVFAAILYASLTYFIGVSHLVPVVGDVEPNSPAAVAGIRAGDVLVSINNNDVKYYSDLEDHIALLKPIELVVLRDNSKQTVTLAPELVESKNIFGDTIKLPSVGIKPQLRAVIGKAIEDQPAALAGLKAGDLIVEIDGTKINSWQEVLPLIKASHVVDSESNSKVNFLNVIVERDGKLLDFKVKPVLRDSYDINGNTIYVPMIGIEQQPDLVVEKVGFFKAVKLGVIDTYETISLTLISVKKLIFGEVSAKSIGGPLMIAEISGKKAQSGLIPFLTLMAFISINLGILNLLPVPVLDGGQLVFFIIEGITGKELGLKFRMVAQWIGIALLGALMLLAFYNDISRIVKRNFFKPVVIETGQENR